MRSRRRFQYLAETTTVTTEDERIIQVQYESGASGRASKMAGSLIGSEILKIAADIRALTAQGRKICNLTVGDFNARYFPIPDTLKTYIEDAYAAGETNYPPSDGVPELRKSIQGFYKRRLGLDFPIESIIVTGGARPAIYASYNALIDPGDVVVYPVPSWNNNHYCHLTGATDIAVACDESTAFLPTRELLEPHIRHARMLTLCSPLNPTGTAFDAGALSDICSMVVEENTRRSKSGERVLFLMYDQVYWMLTFGSTVHHDPIRLCPEIAPYTIYVDGLSKAFASTGLRVGWFVAPPDIAKTMSSLLGHVGAWAPRPEQIATARLLDNDTEIDRYQTQMLPAVEARLQALHEGIQALKADGHPVESITPMGAIYLTVRFDLVGRTLGGRSIATNEDIRKYLLERADIAIVPFQAFGATGETGWFRLSVGAVSMREIEEALPRLANALAE